MRFYLPSNFLFHWAYVFVGEILCGETDEPFDTERTVEQVGATINLKKYFKVR